FEGGVESFPPPPTITRPEVLPFQDIKWENFERLCFQLASRLGEVADCRRYGIQGEKQHGIDIYVRHRSDNRYATWQSKCYARFSASALLKAVNEFLGGEWAGRTAVFHLAVTTSLSPVKLADAVEKARKKCSA